MEREHPGPRPALFEFPFAAAARAREEILAARDAVLATVARHEELFAEAAVGFEGRMRDQFQAGLEQQLQACRVHVEALTAQAEQLAADIRTAERRHDASVDARRRWQRDLDAWARQREGAAG